MQDKNKSKAPEVTEGFFVVKELFGLSLFAAEVIRIPGLARKTGRKLKNSIVEAKYLILPSARGIIVSWIK